MGTKCVVPILPPSYRCRLRRDISQTDNVTVRVVFQSNKNTEGQNAGIKYIQDRTTAKIRIRKAKLNVRFSGGDRITIQLSRQDGLSGRRGGNGRGRGRAEGCSVPGSRPRQAHAKN